MLIPTRGSLSTAEVYPCGRWRAKIHCRMTGDLLP